MSTVGKVWCGEGQQRKNVDEISREGCRRSVRLLAERGALTVLHSGSSISITLWVKLCACFLVRVSACVSGTHPRGLYSVSAQ